MTMSKLVAKRFAPKVDRRVNRLVKKVAKNWKRWMLNSKNKSRNTNDGGLSRNNRSWKWKVANSCRRRKKGLARKGQEVRKREFGKDEEGE